VVLLLPLLVLPQGARATAAGAIKLDNFTFDKMTAIPGVTWLVKFDKTYAYGEKEDAFKALCKLAHKVPNFLVGEVPVTEHGDKDNDDLRERYEIPVESYPAYLMFKGSSQLLAKFEGFADPAARKPATWDDKKDGAWAAPMLQEVTTENVAKWLRVQGVKFPSVGTIFELDEVAQRFVADGMKDTDLAAARALAEGEHKEDPKAAVYIKIFEKIKEKGAEYVAKETERVQKLMTGNLTPEKAAQMNEKLKIMGVFEK